MKDIPEVITILEKKYVIVGIIAFVPPIIDDDISHYVSMIKINNQWERYDDNDRKSPKIVSTKTNVIIHTLMYIRCES